LFYPLSSLSRIPSSLSAPPGSTHSTDVRGESGNEILTGFRPAAQQGHKKTALQRKLGGLVLAFAVALCCAKSPAALYPRRLISKARLFHRFYWLRGVYRGVDEGLQGCKLLQMLRMADKVKKDVKIKKSQKNS